MHTVALVAARRRRPEAPGTPGPILFPAGPPPEIAEDMRRVRAERGRGRVTP